MLKNELTGEEISNEDLHQVALMCQNQLRLERELAMLAERQSELSEALKELAEYKIPDMMLSLGLSEITLSTGEVVSVKKYYSASIPEEQRDSAFAWLRKTGNDDIIKNNLTLTFGKGEDDLAQQVAIELVKRGLAPEQKIFVHPMTLKAFVKEKIEGGKELPQELFGVFVGSKTKITPPKKAK